jgi:hypothetical protein
MSFGGDLTTFEIADVLEWIGRRSRTGTLHLSRGATRKRLVFKDGTLHSSSSNDPRETLGQALVRDRLITEETLFRALLRQEKEGGLLGTILTTDGMITKEQLMAVLRGNAELQVYDVFLWSDGRFEFRDEEIPPPSMVGLEISIPLLLDEGQHRLFEWTRLLSRFPSSEITFKVQKEAHAIEDPTERQVVGLAAAGKTLAAISLEMRRSAFATALMLERLCDCGALAVDQLKSGILEKDPVAAIENLLKAADLFCREGRLDAAQHSYEEVLRLDGVNQRAKKGLIAVSEARQNEKMTSKLPLDKKPVLKMSSLAITRERFDSHEGFVLSRVNGQWDLRSILKLCPLPENEALMIFVRLLDRGVIELQ